MVMARLLPFADIKERMAQPLCVKTVIVPKGQNKYGHDVVRFTADYLASDLFDMCIGCYPPCQNDLKSTLDPESDDSSGRRTPTPDAPRRIVLSQAYDGICGSGNPSTMLYPTTDEVGTPVDVCAMILPHYRDV